MAWQKLSLSFPLKFYINIFKQIHVLQQTFGYAKKNSSILLNMKVGKGWTCILEQVHRKLCVRHNRNCLRTLRIEINYFISMELLKDVYRAGASVIILQVLRLLHTPNKTWPRNKNFWPTLPPLISLQHWFLHKIRTKCINF